MSEPLKLEVGQRYYTRAGTLSGPIDDSGCAFFPFRADVSGTARTFTEKGEWDASRSYSGFDLVRLHLPTEKPSEADPHGKQPHEPGAKLDVGKPQAGLLIDFGNALLAVAEVSTYGANKYSPGGWITVPDGERRYRDAGLRHRLKMATEAVDSESGLDHLYHTAWNVLAELELKIRAAQTAGRGK